MGAPIADTSLVLVDTSVWVRAFHAPRSSEADVLGSLLSIDLLATCAPIRAEVVSGAPTVREFPPLRTRFGILHHLELPTDLWPRLEEHRFALARRGYQASLVDVMIALTSAIQPLNLLDVTGGVWYK